MLLLQAVHGFGEEALHRTGPQEELAREREGSEGAEMMLLDRCFFYTAHQLKQQTIATLYVLPSI